MYRLLVTLQQQEVDRRRGSEVRKFMGGDIDNLIVTLKQRSCPQVKQNQEFTQDFQLVGIPGKMECWFARTLL